MAGSLLNMLVAAVLTAQLPCASASHPQEQAPQRQDGPTKLLLEACLDQTSTPERVRQLVAQGADVHARNRNGATMLMLAARTNPNPDVISALVESGADIDAVDQGSVSVLAYAARSNSNPEVLLRLARLGAEVNPHPLKDPSSPPPPMWDIPVARMPIVAASENRTPAITRTLISLGASVDGAHGRTALLHACGQDRRHSNPAVIPMLVEHGARVHPGLQVEDHAGEPTPLMLLVQSPNELRYQHLERGELETPAVRRILLLEAARTLIEAGADLNARDAKGRTPLLLAHPLFIPLLVESDANINAKTPSGDTVLTSIGTQMFNPEFRAEMETLLHDAVRSLIAHGANVRAVGPNGMTPLITLAYRWPRLTPVFLRTGADVNARDDRGRTALMGLVTANLESMDEEIGEATSWSDRSIKELVQMFVDHGADLDIRDGEGMTALMHAAVNGSNDDAVMALLAAGADRSLRDKSGRTLQDHLAENPHLHDVVVHPASDTGTP